MTISSKTTIQAYQLHKGGTYARMAILRMVAADSAGNFNPHTRLRPGDWRGARHWTLKGYEAAYGTLSPGKNGSEAVWYCHTGESFRNERYCDEIARSINHTGWFCDIYQNGKARGIVAGLSHGRFIAGYELSDSGERVYFDTIHMDETDVALMADEHARVIADQSMEYSKQNQECEE